MDIRRNDYGECERNEDVHFLFETENWNGRMIDKMDSSHIINSLLMLIKRANEFKLKYELFIIDNTGTNKMLKPVNTIEEIMELDATVWVKTTPVFIAMLKELSVRNLLKYFETVLTRIDIAEEKKV